MLSDKTLDQMLGYLNTPDNMDLLVDAMLEAMERQKHELFELRMQLRDEKEKATQQRDPEPKGSTTYQDYTTDEGGVAN